ncbi:MAG: traS protein [Neisseria sp.]|nr:traS protein [Neisseria sp.]
MISQRDIDEWFLGYKTRVVKKRDSNLPIFPWGKKSSVKQGCGLVNLKAAAQKHPEVMVKIPKRMSKNSNGIKGIRSHLEYISRNGQITVETQSGEKLEGSKSIKEFIHEWGNLGIPERSQYREALNIVLSMPSGTPPNAVLNAARNFAAEQFEGHQYVFALHHESEREGEPGHPHVHLCVLMRDEFGQRMNPRKNDLFEWRVHFAEKLREEGVECAATRRQHRGKVIKPENSTLKAMRRRGKMGYVDKQEIEELLRAIKNNERPKHPFIKETMQTRGYIFEQYGLIARELYKMGHKSEAKIISQLAKEMIVQPLTTQAQAKYDAMSNYRQKYSQTLEVSDIER